jgi:predicted transcriptional regulator
MRIDAALPDLLERYTPKVEQGASNIYAIAILLSSDLGVLPIKQSLIIADKSPKRDERRVISGYSVVSGLIQSSPKDYERFLSEPCVNEALTVGTVSFERDDIQSLLHTFESSTFGYALLESSIPGKSGLILIRDLLPLFDQDVLSSSLTVKDVATRKVFSMPQSSSIRDVLKEMLNRKFRRVLVEGGTGDELITDREILQYLFERLFGTPKVDGERLNRLLDESLSNVDSLRVLHVDEGTDLRKAAMLLSSSGKYCALINPGIITPRDLIMKPWRLGELRIRS